MTKSDSQQLAQALCKGERRALAKAITLIEGQRPDQRAEADALLREIMPKTGGATRIGISGPPGVGKSTFIEAIGKLLLAKQRRLAILAIDPTSPLTGGSIMGDRTRMEELSSHPDVFIRPSPTGGTLGGVARHTQETLLACEAAGYDYVFIETVGVGQSETVAASMVDVFLILHLPNAGDELQGIKRGILELADLVAVTKADGPLQRDATRAKLELERALTLARRGASGADVPSVYLCSSKESHGLAAILEGIDTFLARQRASGAFQTRRQTQAVRWFHNELNELLRERLKARRDYDMLMRELEQNVRTGKLPATVAARQVLDRILPVA